jgi:hypothetical protein
MTSELENITRQFADFFKSKQKPPPEGTKKYRLRPQKGWLEEVRAEAFGTLIPGQVSLREGTLWSKLSARVFIIVGMSIYAILAYYDDGTILWLDDHEANDDFEKFSKNEHLWTWLPEHKEDLIELLIETKMHFFGKPQLINSISDIPSYTKQELDQMANDPLLMSQLLEIQQKLEHLSEKIIPPDLLIESDKTFELTFFVWTHILGRIVRAQFKFGKDGLFLYEGNELLKEAGRFSVPR